jgi:hypothetical protein
LRTASAESAVSPQDVQLNPLRNASKNEELSTPEVLEKMLRWANLLNTSKNGSTCGDSPSKLIAKDEPDRASVIIGTATALPENSHAVPAWSAVSDTSAAVTLCATSNGGAPAVATSEAIMIRYWTRTHAHSQTSPSKPG